MPIATASPKLQVLIATFRPSGMQRVVDMELPEVDGVGYVISWQKAEGADIPPEIASRKDILVTRTDHDGVSANRNNALKASNAPLLLIADDDLRYDAEALKAVIRQFDLHPECNLLCFRYEGNDAKKYPAEEFDISKPAKGWWVSSIEIALRRSCLERGLAFDKRFGPNSGVFAAGEDSKLIIDALAMGLKGRFIPLTVCRHDGETTGIRLQCDPKVIQSWGALAWLLYPGTFLLRAPLRAWRLNRSTGISFLTVLRNIFKGVALWMRVK